MYIYKRRKESQPQQVDWPHYFLLNEQDGEERVCSVVGKLSQKKFHFLNQDERIERTLSLCSGSDNYPALTEGLMDRWAPSLTAAAAVDGLERLGQRV